jgi:hypothetical protein
VGDTVLDLHQMVQQRGYDIVEEYVDHGISGARARPTLDKLMADARCGRFDIVVVWAADRLARSVKHFVDNPPHIPTAHRHPKIRSPRSGITCRTRPT